MSGASHLQLMPTPMQAMESVGKEPFPTIYVDGKVEGEVRSVQILCRLC